ncbi:MAG: hypothetical protein HY361_02815 [Candidatus Aenigmarchaeota archaeon]|nr:hypothetical protein [Candidatus Aenigmarchaeota archaeon]
MGNKERVIKESELMLKKNMMSYQKGILTLTSKKLLFSIKKGFIQKKEEELFDIPLQDIRSADAIKVWAQDGLQIRFNKNSKVETLTFINSSMGGQTLQTTNPLFVGWSQAINDARDKV